jgi:uncharacterized protein YndB with AHSA1/START domain
MSKGLVSQASVSIHAPAAKVWEALVSPAAIKRYMVGTEVVSTWAVGAPIHWKGDYQGRKYEDKGVILKLEPQRVLQYTHFSPLAGEPDLPENYHTVTLELEDRGAESGLRLSQDNNPTEESRAHSAKFWQAMLETLKALLEH